jgi:hypothetical protein
VAATSGDTMADAQALGDRNVVYQEHPDTGMEYGVCIDCAGSWHGYDSEDGHVCGEPDIQGIITLDQYGFDVGGFLLRMALRPDGGAAS